MVKRYGDRYKLVYLNAVRISGYEEVLDEWEMFERKHGRKIKGTCKLENSISRSKSRIYEIAICNEWSHFMTGTIDPKKHDRYDLPGFRKKLNAFIKNQRVRVPAPDLKYLIIPEQHMDGAWHFHGLLTGIKPEMLTEFGSHVPFIIRSKYRNYHAYTERFGYCSVGEIQNKEAVAAYITKYITKEMAKTNVELGNNLYYCSQGLKRSEKIKEGRLRTSPTSWDFENEYVKVKWIDKEDIDNYII